MQKPKIHLWIGNEQEPLYKGPARENTKENRKELEDLIEKIIKDSNYGAKGSISLTDANGDIIAIPVSILISSVYRIGPERKKDESKKKTSKATDK